MTDARNSAVVYESVINWCHCLC